MHLDKQVIWPEKHFLKSLSDDCRSCSTALVCVNWAAALIVHVMLPWRGAGEQDRVFSTVTILSLPHNPDKLLWW